MRHVCCYREDSTGIGDEVVSMLWDRSAAGKILFKDCGTGSRFGLYGITGEVDSGRSGVIQFDPFVGSTRSSSHLDLADNDVGGVGQKMIRNEEEHGKSNNDPSLMHTHLRH